MNSKEKARLVAAAHHLNPVIMIGQKGLTPNVIAETDQALTAHELIKVKIRADDKTARLEIIEQICRELGAEFLKAIGNTMIVYRKRPD